jgi:hypothetical protein
MLLAGRVGADSWRVWEASGGALDAWRELGVVSGVEAAPALLPLDGESKLALVWPGSGAGELAGKASRDRLGAFLNIEQATLSIQTGRVLDRGAMAVADSGSASQYRFIAIMMSWVVGLVVLVLVRPKEDSVFLPGDVSLAEPLRRMVAGMIDLTIVSVVAALIVGRSFEDVMSIGVGELFITDSGQALLLTVIALGVASSTLSETLNGRTFGKMFAGCVVVRCVRPGADASHALKASAPSFGQSLVRNLIKWCLPPAAMVALWREGARHRGDQYTNTAVVVPIPPEEMDEDESGM